MKAKEKHKAKQLRAKGYSVKEIARKLNVAQGSVSMWVRDIVLSVAAQKRLLNNIKLGQFNAAQNKKARTEAAEQTHLKNSIHYIKNLGITNNHSKLLCAIIYWCEGNKNPKNGVCFTNSDPKLIASFLKLLRSGFDIDENKFRPCIHLHSYHSPKKQLDFWSKITKISKGQFIKPYIKPNTGKRYRDNYQGCISIRYHSNDLARQLMALAKTFLSY